MDPSGLYDIDFGIKLKEMQVQLDKKNISNLLCHYRNPGITGDVVRAAVSQVSYFYRTPLNILAAPVRGPKNNHIYIYST
jgi:hypothetical protein